MTDTAETFESHRRYLIGLAYRMLGSVAEAEDVVQDAFLRWQGRSDEDVAAPRAFLSRIVTRLCLDRLKSARAQREQYVGTWLPEPVVETGEGPADTAMSMAEDLSVALLVTLERLSPLERAAFLLHDVFEMEFDEVASVLQRSEAAVRQLASRARDHVRTGRTRFEVSSDVSARITAAFHNATLHGDLDAFSRMLAENAVLYSDGGGKRSAAINPIYGRDKILRFFAGVTRKRALAGAFTVERATINGMPGLVLHGPDGVETLALEIEGDHVVAVYIVRNPDKLRHLAAD